MVSCPWTSSCVAPIFSFQVLFACAEALHAHGYSSEASRLTVELAQDLLANPPDLKVEPPPAKVRDPVPLPSPLTPNPLPCPTPSESLILPPPRGVRLICPPPHASI